MGGRESERMSGLFDWHCLKCGRDITDANPATNPSGGLFGCAFCSPLPGPYPESAGHKERGGTSQLAGDSIDAATIRAKVKDGLRRAGPMTADETADYLGIDRLSIRPRLSELLALGEVEKTTTTRKNQSGHAARVWRVL